MQCFCKALCNALGAYFVCLFKGIAGVDSSSECRADYGHCQRQVWPIARMNRYALDNPPSTIGKLPRAIGSADDDSESGSRDSPLCLVISHCHCCCNSICQLCFNLLVLSLVSRFRTSCFSFCSIDIYRRACLGDGADATWHAGRFAAQIARTETHALRYAKRRRLRLVDTDLFFPAFVCVCMCFVFCEARLNMMRGVCFAMAYLCVFVPTLAFLYLGGNVGIAHS